MKEIRTSRTYGPPTAERMNRADEKMTNVVAAINAQNRNGEQWTEARFSANGNAQPWQIALCDPTAAAFQLMFPAAPGCIGAWIVVKNITSSTNAIIVRPISGNVDGASSISLNTALGTKKFRASTDGWWEI